ncbi:3-deoxy-D-manno-octulosonic acid transferase [Bacteroidales bacterium OttesenSCG-928-K03]|nr:3-deoxy-D-manno-octulosonic acid transferase [Odoribacter sp. OttesenSCG-928-L07]MDL2238804.1 3-deoxy-D-manno-octulosonic acid transferase [Bacteroidales bacterium OttesenSCG-928-L14]MDL2240990.1 3-deoxy-D-manno-octulosonic acid transferase [Bacteroidales bacterium OttesenSCG-928-K22]MDL2242183.1 3-deoxy-D-manno-octulosonic acid transferase [Bacteroidales bacterium OttesenSCG-928-K03]
MKKLDHGEGIIWFHCASLGEYEQGLPVIINTKKKYPNHKILVTFFSPSGFKNQKPQKEIDYTFYMPLDTIINAYRFVNIIRPVFVVFVKYEFWFNNIWVLKEAEIPIIYISCNIRKTQYFFKWYGGWFRQRLRKVTHYFVQNEESKILLENIRIKQVTIAGDTRYDRVKTVANSDFFDEKIAKFIGDEKNVVVAGSTWQKDEQMILEVLPKLGNYKIIIVPHEVNDENIIRIKELFKTSLLYSDIDDNETINTNILVVNCVGLLSRLYRYAKFAYIGGGFGKGIHNILEATAYDTPVIFGPKYKQYNEAVTLVEAKGAFSFSKKEELNNIVDNLLNDDFLQSAKKACHDNFDLNLGATDKIMEAINL